MRKQLNQSIFDSQEKSRMAKQIEILNEVYYKQQQLIKQLRK